MSRPKQPRITISAGEYKKDVPVINSQISVKICTKCNGYAFDIQNFTKSEINTVCSCGQTRNTIEKKIPMTDENLRAVREAYEQILK